MATATRFPVLYLSHGSPMSGFKVDEASEFWKRIGSQIKTFAGLKAVLVVSAHWETRGGHRITTTSTKHETIHDFYGFPAALYKFQYGAMGSPAVAQRAMQLLAAKNIAVHADPARGLDHGAWVPLKWMFPAADVPIVQLSLAAGGSMKDHLMLGEALRPLRDEGVLLLGSGSAVHNLRDAGRYFGSGKVADFVMPFDSELEKIVAGSTDIDRELRMTELENFPGLQQAHPTLEHLLPLHVAVGAAGPDPGSKLFHKVEFSFSEAAFGFGKGFGA